MHRILKMQVRFFTYYLCCKVHNFILSFTLWTLLCCNALQTEYSRERKKTVPKTGKKSPQYMEWIYYIDN